MGMGTNCAEMVGNQGKFMSPCNAALNDLMSINQSRNTRYKTQSVRSLHPSNRRWENHGCEM